MSIPWSSSLAPEMEVLNPWSLSRIWNRHGESIYRGCIVDFSSVEPWTPSSEHRFLVLSAKMHFLLVKVVGAVLILGQYLADGPMPPTLDFMLKSFGFRMVPAGIEQVFPLLLTYVAPPGEPDNVPE